MYQLKGNMLLWAVHIGCCFKQVILYLSAQIFIIFCCEKFSDSFFYLHCIRWPHIHELQQQVDLLI